jgi:hypothetical protein
VGGEPLAAEVGLGQAVPLHHRPHGPVQDQDPVAEDGVENVDRLPHNHRRVLSFMAP